MFDSPSTIELLEAYLRDTFNKKLYSRLIQRVERWTLYAAPLNPLTYPKGNTSTLYRWELPQARYPYLYASEEKCRAARYKLLAQIVFMEGDSLPLLQTDLQTQLRQDFPDIQEKTYCPITKDAITVNDVKSALGQTSRIGSLELNFDFLDFSKSSNHLEYNSIQWVKPPYYLYYLRNIFATYRNLLSKVQTKAYLTDRRQTGGYPTNREARWETHPNSPQFACFRECIHIEAKILAQILEFSGAPTVEIDGYSKKKIEEIIGAGLRPGTFRCPISGQFINYDEFIQATIEPEHGRSRYQVAHLVPLATENGHHSAANTSWITELGNRVQGEDPLDEIVDKIFLMAQYHKERLELTWQEIEQRVAQADMDVKEG